MRVLAFCLALCVAANVTANPAEDEVRAVEQDFANTLANRDFAAFQRFLSEDVTFQSNGEPLKGKQAVAASWAEFFIGEEAPFSWAPDLVLLRDNGRLALSSGPVMNPEGERYATFTSVWERQADGRWRIIFDKGERWCPPTD